MSVRQNLGVKVLTWVEKCKQEGAGAPGFMFSELTRQPTVMSLCFAILTKELYGNLSSFEHEFYRDILLASQGSETGLFMDPVLAEEDIDPSGPGKDYSIYQTTYFALNALDALGENPYYPLTFIKPYLDHVYLERWLNDLDWSDPWEESNWIMFIGSSLYHHWQEQDDHCALAALYHMLDWLDKCQDLETGFWGVASGAPLLNAMAGAYHFLPFYFGIERPVQFPESMIESTLALQHSDGLFHPDGGGDSCLDVDAVDILVKCSLVTDYRSSQVEAALERAFHGLMGNQSADGGFCRALRRPLPPKSQKRRVAETIGLDLLLRKPYVPPREIRFYDGWRKMPYDIRHSDLFSTWFRSFGLALISNRYPEKFPLNIDWRFRKIPALGWHDPEKVLASKI